MEGTAGCYALFHVLVFLASPNDPGTLKFVLEVYKNKLIN